VGVYLFCVYAIDFFFPTGRVTTYTVVLANTTRVYICS
jgi:hypothetical protein